MADSKPITAEELASRTGTAERYIRDGLQFRLLVGTLVMTLVQENILYRLNKQ